MAVDIDFRGWILELARGAIRMCRLSLGGRIEDRRHANFIQDNFERYVLCKKGMSQAAEERVALFVSGLRVKVKSGWTTP